LWSLPLGCEIVRVVLSRLPGRPQTYPSPFSQTSASERSGCVINSKSLTTAIPMFKISLSPRLLLGLRRKIFTVHSRAPGFLSCKRLVTGHPSVSNAVEVMTICWVTPAPDVFFFIELFALPRSLFLQALKLVEQFLQMVPCSPLMRVFRYEASLAGLIPFFLYFVSS